MTRKNANLAGNALMILGLVIMVGSVGSAILNQLPQLQMPQLMVNGAVFGIFVGALLWLVGARISGREKVCDRYYWLRHYGDKRCRRSHEGQ
ncbi:MULTISPECIES: stress-induced protein YchH [Erwinia]|uniref:stress-induced protein YchH n=1 Tax=Erwinia TaxID=551 RepID=UPI000553F3A0|nr:MULTISPECIES: stress-induced protein YchH [Erwinia]